MEKRITTLEGHQALLQHVFDTAKSRVTVVSPFISDVAIMHDDISGIAAQAVSRGVAVDVFIDDTLNCEADRQLKKTAHDGIVSMLRAGATVTVLPGIHHKTLIRDNDLITDGSFNWLSAVRQKGGNRQREERTVVNTGDQVFELIAAEHAFLQKDENAFSVKLKTQNQQATPAAQPVPRPRAARKGIKMYNRFYHKKWFQIGIYLATAVALPFLPDVGDALVLLAAVVFWFFTTKPKMSELPLRTGNTVWDMWEPWDEETLKKHGQEESYGCGSSVYTNPCDPFWSNYT